MDGPDSFGLLLSATARIGVSGIGISRFEGARFSGPLVSQMPKRRLTATCPSDGWRQPSAKINGRDLFGMINGHDQVPAFLNLIHTSRHFGVSVIGISRVTKTRVLALWFPRVPKCQSAYQQPRVLYRWMVQVLPWIMGSTVPISSLLTKIKEKGLGI
jgi:hypothetical protein